MSPFRCIKTFLLLLHLTAVTGQYTFFVVRVGDEASLPCEIVPYNQNECENTKWLFSGAGNTPSVELVVLKSDRLSVTEKCSLVIKKVTVEDVGRYTCRQFRSGNKQGEDAPVYLSVITYTEYEDNGTVTFSCSVSTFGWCTQRVKWLFRNDVDKGVRDVNTSHSYCSAIVTFRTSHHSSTPYGSLICEATDIFTGKVQQFNFSPQSSGEDATTMRTTEEDTKATPASNDTTKPQGWWRFIIVSVGLAALIISVVAVNIWTRTKENKTQMDENTVHNDQADGTVSYENLGDLYASVRIH